MMMGGNLFKFPPIFKYMLSPGLIIGIISGLGLGLLMCVPALLHKKRLDTAKLKEYEEQKNELQHHIDNLSQEIIEKDKDRINLEGYINNLSNDISQKHERLNELRGEESNLRSTLASLADTEQKVKENMEKSIEKESEILSKEFQQAREDYQKEYNLARQEMVDQFSKTIVNKQAELSLIENAINDKQAIYDAILEMELRKAKEKEERDFYRLNIPKEDLEEIERIRDITPYLRNPEVLNKVLWTSYYQKPYQDLIARQFKDRKPSGIYKITCLPDDKIYIGQSVNVPNRFSEHIKRGLGAEPATRNRLYPAMKKWGVENFIFELLEEVPREKLDERERYWIQFFHSAETGLNGNKGVKG